MRAKTGAAAHVGRISALAVALGIGAAVASGQGVAWADTTGSGASDSGSADTTAPTPTSTESDSAAEGSPSAGTATSSIPRNASTPAKDKAAGKGRVSSSGGALTSKKVAGKSTEAQPGKIDTDIKEAAAQTPEETPSDPVTPSTDLDLGEAQTPTPKDSAPSIDTDVEAAEADIPSDPVTPSANADLEKVSKSKNSESKNEERAITLAVPPSLSAAGSTSAATSTKLKTAIPDLPPTVRAHTVVAVKDTVDAVKDAAKESAETESAVVKSVGEAITASVAAAAPSVDTPPELTAAPPTPPVEPEQPTVRGVVSGILAGVGLAPLAGDAPVAPTQSPGLWALAASARREFDPDATPAAKMATAQTGSVATAALVDPQAEVVDPLPNSLDSTPVGWVTGQNNSGYPGANWEQTNDTAGFGIYGTDLGIMWDNGLPEPTHYVLTAFGDTFSGPNMTGDWRSNVLLLSTDDNLSDGMDLLQTGYAYQFIPSAPGALGWLGSEVTIIPTSGVSVDGEQYVNYMSVKSWDTPGQWTTNYSAVSMYDQDTDKWDLQSSTIRSAGYFRSTTPYVAGSQNFQQAAYVLQPEDKVAPGETRYLYAFGTPSGRAGSAYLSRVADGSVTDLSEYEYWDGDTWVADKPAVAAPIIGDSTNSTGLFGSFLDWANDPNVLGGSLAGWVGAKTGGNVSEMSVQYNEYLDKYVVMYADGNNDMQMRLADEPEGPWSDPITVATSAEYPGLYAPMIHPWSGTGLLMDSNGQPDDDSLYWNMSLWGNYNVVLMETDLEPLTVTPAA